MVLEQPLRHIRKSPPKDVGMTLSAEQATFFSATKEKKDDFLYAPTEHILLAPKAVPSPSSDGLYDSCEAPSSLRHAGKSFLEDYRMTFGAAQTVFFSATRTKGKQVN